jgi:DNA-3-methyladenine glycosylase II
VPWLGKNMQEIKTEMSTDYFHYGELELNYLKLKDKKLAHAIETIGFIKRPIRKDLFSSLVQSIVGQQISNKANQTILKRMHSALGDITPLLLQSLSDKDLQAFGLTFRKVAYIKNISQQNQDNVVNLEALRYMSDETVIHILSELKGVGVWTAEMFLIHSLSRSNVISYRDLAIIKGMRMLYRHREINKPQFNKYKKRYSPYATVASFYLWQISAGAIPELTDPRQRN